MGERLDELTKLIRSAIGRLTGSMPLEPDGRAGHALASAGRKTPPESRPAAGRFRDGVGQMTLDERLAAQSEADRRHDKANRHD